MSNTNEYICNAKIENIFFRAKETNFTMQMVKFQYILLPFFSLPHPPSPWQLEGLSLSLELPLYPVE